MPEAAMLILQSGGSSQGMRQAPTFPPLYIPMIPTGIIFTPTQ